MSRPLYQISDSFIELIAAFEACTDEEMPGIVARFDALEHELEAKLCACIAWAREESALADAAKAESVRLAELSKVRANRVERVRQMVRMVLEQQGRTKVDTKLGPVRIVKNGGKSPVVFSDAFKVETLPEDCRRTVVEPVKTRIRELLEAGQTIEGASIGSTGFRVELG
jgi:hypothetical protein